MKIKLLLGVFLCAFYFTANSQGICEIAWGRGPGVLQIVCQVGNRPLLYKETQYPPVNYPSYNGYGDFPQIIETWICKGEKVRIGFKIDPINQSVCYSGCIVNWTVGEIISGYIGQTGTINNTIEVQPTSDTGYMFQIKSVSGKQCSSATAFIVHVRDTPALTLTPNALTICPDVTVGLTATGASTNTYEWWPTTNMSPSSSTVVFVSPKTTTTYTVRAKDVNKCISEASSTITVLPAPTVSVRSQDFCQSTTREIVATGTGTSYTWSPATNLSATSGTTVSFNTGITGVYPYTVTAKDANGCSAQASFNIRVNPKVEFEVSPNASICEGASTTLSVQGGANNTYTWEPSTGLNKTEGTSVIASPSSTLTPYSVIATNEYGCYGRKSVSVYVDKIPLMDFSTTLCPSWPRYLQVNNQAGSNVVYTWSPSTYLSASSGSMVNFLGAPSGTYEYTVNAVSPRGCKKTMTYAVKVKDNTGVNFDKPIEVGTLPMGATYTNTQNTAYENCFADDYGPKGEDVFYRFTIDQAAKVTVNHCGSLSSNTIVDLLDASRKLIVNSEKSGVGCSNAELASITLNLAAGTYFVVSEAYDRGIITTSIKAEPCTPSVGSTFANPIQLGTLGDCYRYTDNKNNGLCFGTNYGYASPEIIYKFSLTAEQVLTLSTCNSELEDTYLYVLDANKNNAVVASRDDYGPSCPASRRSSISQAFQPGTYYLVVEGYGSYVGNIKLELNVNGRWANELLVKPQYNCSGASRADVSVPGLSAASVQTIAWTSSPSDVTMASQQTSLALVGVAPTAITTYTATFTLKADPLCTYVKTISIDPGKLNLYLIPDANYRNALKLQYPTCFQGDLLDVCCAGQKTTQAVDGKQIQSLEGIQFFKSLQKLTCSNNLLTELPLLPGTVNWLECSQNKLTGLSPLPGSLGYLNCSSNELSTLPPLPTGLYLLQCSSNKLSSLPPLPSGSLTTLSCSNNKLTSLPPLPLVLQILSCGTNQLTALPALTSTLVSSLSCENNLLTVVPTLPASLTGFTCYQNKLTSLPDLPKKLLSLQCFNNQLSALPASLSTTSLTYLNCSSNQLVSLPPLPATLQELISSSCQLGSLPAPLPPALKNLSVSSNKITSLPPLPASLQSLFCSQNRVAYLPALSPSLTLLDCQKNCITLLPPAPANYTSWTVTPQYATCANGRTEAVAPDGQTEPISETERLTIIPNPANDFIQTNLKGLKIIYNASGAEVFRADASYLDISSLAKGVYVVYDSNTQQRVPFIKAD